MKPLRSDNLSTSEGEWTYLVGTEITAAGMPSLVRAMAEASVVPPCRTSN